MQNHLKIAVIGDPHFRSGEFQSGPHYSFNHLANFAITPWNTLKEYVEYYKITADILVCVGDMTTKADSEALTACWRELCEMAKLLKAKFLISTAGNHDVHSVIDGEILKGDSGFRSMENYKGLVEELKLLHPPFPIVEFNEREVIHHKELRTEYFGNNLAYVDCEDYAIFSYNSCSEHGHARFERERGTFPESSSRHLREVVNNLPYQKGKVNIFVLHHPIIPLSNHNTGGYDYVDKGDLLSEILEETSANWLVIHGHKHFLRLRYGIGTRYPPIMFSASSLGMPSINELTPHETGNQFYIIDLFPDQYNLQGEISVWQWSLGKKWESKANGSPVQVLGFGARNTPQYYVDKIAEFYQSQDSREVSWRKVVDNISELQFVLPTTHEKIKELLDRQYFLVKDHPEVGLISKRLSNT